MSDKSSAPDVEAAYMRVLLRHTNEVLMHAKTLLSNPMFRCGAQLTIDEILPARAWAQLRLQELEKQVKDG